MNYPEKQEAISILKKMNWTFEEGSKQFGFTSADNFRKFLLSEKKCKGIDFIRSLQRVRGELNV